ncbi:MAG: sigma-54 dependent transcriptional regulator [Myxococcales bacterium]|nr:sigma-54 dependent transcriptional regulator [Myxococcales bacterium]
MLVRTLVMARPTLHARALRLLRHPDLHVVGVKGPARIWAELEACDADLLVVERSALPDEAGSWVATVRELPERPDVIVLGRQEDAADRAELLAAGALAVLNLGLPDDALVDAIAALVIRHLDAQRGGEAPGFQPEVQRLDDFSSSSPAMTTFLDVARRAAFGNTSLLLLGETGVGKERMARALHHEGKRGRGPFVAFNCAALPESLIESELFGHERGAFTGAVRAHRGYFERAHGGTLFIDEVGELPLHLQAKLLRVLEERALRRLGGEQVLPVDVRIMAATNRDLETEVEAKRFRADLFFRLAVVTLTIPPLRERQEDIPRLARTYFDHFRVAMGKPQSGIAPEAMEALVRYEWPGNVRELINVLERAVLLARDEALGLADLPPAISRGPMPATPTPRLVLDVADVLGQSIKSARQTVVDRFEAIYIEALLARHGGKVGAAARGAALTERMLYNLMRKHGLTKRMGR